jgi:hypothetical protein
MPLPFTAMRASTTGSSAWMALITGRSSTSSRREKPPAGNRFSGMPRSLTEARSIMLPAGSSRDATTTCFSATARGRPFLPRAIW